MFFREVFATLVLAIWLPSMADSAEIQISNDSECRVEIVGPIVQGDMAALGRLASYLIVDNGESTSGSVLCLDSPGGSVIEGMALAQFILENGVSTRIRAEKQCASICAIMFMMGNYRGGEVAGLSRRMHYTSRLGFHRPYIRAGEAQLYTSSDLSSTYDLGMETVFEILTLANQREPWGTAQMIEPELMQIMTGTPSNNMFYVSTVEETARWRIGIEGSAANVSATSSRLHYACENALAYPVALTSELNGNDGVLGQAIFDFTPLNAYSVDRLVTDARVPIGQRVQVASVRAGYSTVGCEVQSNESSVAVCGYDERTDVRVGDCDTQSGMRYFSSTAMLHPKTQLATLGLPDPHNADARQLVRCETYDEERTQTDRQICLHSVFLTVEGNKPFARHYLLWPSGSRTVMEIDAMPYGETSDSVRINGSLGTHVPFIEGANCVTNSFSGNTVCLSPMTR
jgi:hypothetical protein